MALYEEMSNVMMLTQTVMMDALQHVKSKAVKSVVSVKGGCILLLVVIVRPPAEMVIDKGFNNVMMVIRITMMDALRLARLNNAIKSATAMDGAFRW